MSLGNLGERLHEIIFPSAARATTTINSADHLADPTKVLGLGLFLNISAVSGTNPTLDIKIQQRDPISGSTTYLDLTGAAFAQKTGTGADYLVIYPGTIELTNKKVSHPVPLVWRVVATTGGTAVPTFTYTLAAIYFYKE